MQATTRCFDWLFGVHADNHIIKFHPQTFEPHAFRSCWKSNCVVQKIVSRRWFLVGSATYAVLLAVMCLLLMGCLNCYEGLWVIPILIPVLLIHVILLPTIDQTMVCYIITRFEFWYLFILACLFSILMLFEASIGVTPFEDGITPPVALAVAVYLFVSTAILFLDASEMPIWWKRCFLVAATSACVGLFIKRRVFEPDESMSVNIIITFRSTIRQIATAVQFLQIIYLVKINFSIFRHPKNLVIFRSLINIELREPRPFRFSIDTKIHRESTLTAKIIQGHSPTPKLSASIGTPATYASPGSRDWRNSSSYLGTSASTTEGESRIPSITDNAYQDLEYCENESTLTVPFSGRFGSPTPGVSFDSEEGNVQGEQPPDTQKPAQTEKNVVAATELDCFLSSPGFPIYMFTPVISYRPLVFFGKTLMFRLLVFLYASMIVFFVVYDIIITHFEGIGRWTHGVLRQDQLGIVWMYLNLPWLLVFLVLLTRYDKRVCYWQANFFEYWWYVLMCIIHAGCSIYAASILQGPVRVDLLVKAISLPFISIIMLSSDAALFWTARTKQFIFFLLITIQIFEYIDAWTLQPDITPMIDFPLLFKASVHQFDILVLQQLILFSVKFALSLVFHKNSFFIIRSDIYKHVKQSKSSVSYWSFDSSLQ